MEQKKKNKIYIIDVTNRDGVQTAKLGLAKLEKTMLNIMLNDMGIYQSEFGFPFTKHETNYINANLELADLGLISPMILEGWSRAVAKDIEESCKNTNVKHWNLSISTSKQMTDGKFGGKITRDFESKGKPSVLGLMADAVKTAKKLGALTVGVNAEDASRTDMEYLIKFAKYAKEHGADRIRYCDTLGFDNSFSIYERVKTLAEEVKIPIELHCHNDLGLAVACSIAGAKGAIDGGVDAYINTTLNGMGERAGNADLVSVILAIKKSSKFGESYKLDDRIKLKQAWKMAKYASYAFGVPIPVNQVAVGENAFAHESGIHADGALKDRRNYELYDFEELGRGEDEIIDTGRKITAGEYSGVKGFRNVYGKLEVEFKDDREAIRILDLVRYANVHTQKPLTNYELRFIANYPKQAKQIMTVTP
ncbi:homocitrate synthase [bacterium]|nr:homocitrate synthase [bacterium]